MRYDPVAVSLSEGQGSAPPHIELRSVFCRRANMAKAMREGHVIARSDADVTDLETNWAFERREPFLRTFS